MEKIIFQFGQRTSRGRNEATGLAAHTASLSLKVLGIVSALGTVNVNVSAVVAGLGLTGFALGFALKDAISNLLAGCMILFYRPFRLSDSITVTGLTGVVTEINLRYTVLGDDDKTYLIPNSLLLNNPIIIAKKTDGRAPAAEKRDSLPA